MVRDTSEKTAFSPFKSIGNGVGLCSSEVVSFSQRAKHSSERAQLTVSDGGISFEQATAARLTAYGNAPQPSNRHGRKADTRSCGKRVGLIVRGRTFYVCWMVPRKLQPIVGKKHFVKSLRTGVLKEAVRRAREVGAEFEHLLRVAEGKTVDAKGAMPEVAMASINHVKTFEEVFQRFVEDPTRKRTSKTISRYHESIAIIYDVISRDTPVNEIDREASRCLLETLQWLPTNSPKRFPEMTAVAAAEMARSMGMIDTLSPVSINGYMTTFSSIMNFAVNEGFIGRTDDPVDFHRNGRKPYALGRSAPWSGTRHDQANHACGQRNAQVLLHALCNAQPRKYMDFQ